jgi:hypothetical protein
MMHHSDIVLAQERDGYGAQPVSLSAGAAEKGSCNSLHSQRTSDALRDKGNLGSHVKSSNVQPLT